MAAHPGSELEAIERASVDELRALQLRRLQASVKHAYDHSPLYRQKWAAAGVHPEDIQSLADLGRLPFTDKQDLRDHYPFAAFAVPMEKIVRLHASSGTTGKPTVVGYTQPDIDVWATVMARSIRAAGGHAGDICHVAYGYGLFTGGLGAHYGAERLGCTVVPMSGGQTERQVQLIQDFKPSIIMVTPSYCLNIADQFEHQGIDPASSSLRLGILGAEPWSNAMRAEIEARMGIDAVDIYGLSEVIGPGVAQECIETRDGPTIWEDHFYPEIIDPDSGAVVADGGEGELVFTSLTKEAMPLIRYRTRDLTRLLPGTARPMRRMDKITGRSDDMMIIRGVNVFPSLIEEQILRERELAPHYQIELRKDGQLDAITVQVEIKPGVADSAHRRTRLAAAVAQHIKTYIGISAGVVVVEAGAVPRSQGKAQRVVDRR